MQQRSFSLLACFCWESSRLSVVSAGLTLTLKPIPQRRVCNFLLYGGTTFEAIAWFLDSWKPSPFSS
jgi:hypothetical protein